MLRVKEDFALLFVTVEKSLKPYLRRISLAFTAKAPLMWNDRSVSLPGESLARRGENVAQNIIN